MFTMISICLHTMQRRDECIYSGSITRKLRQVLDGVHHSSSCVSEGKHEALISDEVLHAALFSAAVVGDLEELGGAADAAPCWEEDGEGGEEVAVGGPGVFKDKVFENVVADLESAGSYLLVVASEDVKMCRNTPSLEVIWR